MKTFGIAIASIVLASTAVLAADPNTPTGNTAAPASVAAPPTTLSPDADTAIPPPAAMSLQTQAPNTAPQQTHAPSAGTPPKTEAPGAGAPPQTQAPNGQAQPTNNNTQSPLEIPTAAPVPHVDDIQLPPMNLVGGNTLAVLSDSGSQSVILTTALAAEPNARPTNTAAPGNTTSPLATSAPGVNAIQPVTATLPQTQAPKNDAPPQTQTPIGKAQPATNNSRMPGTANDIRSANLNPVDGSTTTPPSSVNTAPPVAAMSPQTQAPSVGTAPTTEAPNAGAPPQTQAPTNQVRPVNNITRAPGNTPTPHINDFQRARVNPIGSQLLAAPSDSGSQSADAGGEDESKLSSSSDLSSGRSGSKSMVKPKTKKSGAPTTTGLVGAAVVVMAVTAALM